MKPGGPSGDQPAMQATDRPERQGDSGAQFQAKIEQLLQENGFDVEKFRNELKSATLRDSSPLDLFGSIRDRQGVNVDA